MLLLRDVCSHTLGCCSSIMKAITQVTTRSLVVPC